MHKDKIMSLGGTFNYIGKQIGRLYKYVSNFLKITIFGNSKQETTTGKNLLKLNNETVTSNNVTSIIDDTVINISGTASSSWYDITNQNIHSIPAGTYTLSIQEAIEPSFYFYYTLEDDTTGNVYISRYSDKKVTFTIEQPIKKYYLVMTAISGTTYNYTIHPMLEIGSNATSWEKYTGGASPNPDYPQEIEVVDGYNLFGLNDFSGDYNSRDYTSFGNNISIKTNYGIVSALNITSNEFRITTKNAYDNSQKWLLTNLKPNTTYTISSDIENNLTTGNIRIFDTQLSYNVDKISKIFTTNENGEYEIPLMFYGLNGASDRYAILKNVQLAEGTQPKPYLPYNNIGVKVTGTSYEPYQETIYPIDLQGNTICKLPNGTKDELSIDNKGNVLLTKKVGKYIITSDNVDDLDVYYIGMSYGHNSVRIQKRNIGWKTSWDTGVSLMNRYKEVTSTSAVSHGTYAFNFMADYYTIYDDRFTDIATAKNLLIGTEIYIQLATPTTINLGKLPTPIKTKEGINNIELLTNIDTTFNVE